jgi:hypothetical protein
MKTFLYSSFLLIGLAALPLAAAPAVQAAQSLLVPTEIDVAARGDGNGNYVFHGSISDMPPGGRLVISGMEEVENVEVLISITGRFMFGATIRRPGIVTIEVVDANGNVVAERHVAVN